MMSRKTLLIFFLPGAIFMMAFLVVPLVQMLVNSFFNYELGGEREFIGLANYIKLFTSSSFLKPLRNTIVYVVIAVSFELIFGLVMALLFNTPFPGNKVLRSFFLTPLMIAPIVAGLIWKLMLNTQFGIVNMLLEKIGIIGNINDIMWLADPNIALISCCIADIWLTTPFMMLMLLAGLNGLDHSVIEAASIDGASAFQKFFRIKLPGIMPVLLTDDDFNAPHLSLAEYVGTVIGKYYCDTRIKAWELYHHPGEKVTAASALHALLTLYGHSPKAAREARRSCSA